MKTMLRRIVLAVCLAAISPLSCFQAQLEPTINDKDMSVIDFAELGYPPLARQTRTQGVVVVRVRLDNDGKVSEGIAISGPELLVADSVANAKKWRFRPNAHRAAVIVYNFRMPLASCKSVASFFMFQAPNFATITGCETPVNPTEGRE